jgi:hypothetical protein
MGDLDVAFFFQQTGGFSVRHPPGHPGPADERPPDMPRVLPAARFPSPTATGRSGRAGVPGRPAEFLRQLSGPSPLSNANATVENPLTGVGARGPLNDRVSLTGMTGFKRS